MNAVSRHGLQGLQCPCTATKQWLDSSWSLTPSRLVRWREWQKKNRRLQAQLQSYGMSGVVAYGLCNTLYYTFAFLFIWLYVAQVPRGKSLSCRGRFLFE